MMLGDLPEWLIGRLELTAGNPQAAVGELRTAVARADALELLWMRGWARVDLALALHRCGERGQARTLLAEADELAGRFGLGLIAKQAAIARAELDGRVPPPIAAPVERPRPLRGITSRTGRRTLAAMVRGLDDAALERRFAEPRRQRALLRAQVRAFQPARADGFHGVGPRRDVRRALTGATPRLVLRRRVAARSRARTRCARLGRDPARGPRPSPCRRPSARGRLRVRLPALRQPARRARRRHTRRWCLLRHGSILERRVR